MWRRNTMDFGVVVVIKYSWAYGQNLRDDDELSKLFIMKQKKKIIRIYIYEQADIGKF